MKAGEQMDYRKIDALVAEHVMGWKKGELNWTIDELWIDSKGSYKWVGKFSPSTNISDAWQVVEKLQADGYMYSISSILANGKFTTQVEFARNTDFDLKWYKKTTKTAPLAICLSALRAKGVIEG